MWPFTSATPAAAPPAAVVASASASMDKCPVDEKTRLAWLAQQEELKAQGKPTQPHPFAAAASSTTQSSSSSPPPTPSSKEIHSITPAGSLPTDREISSIPRHQKSAPSPAHESPETENWVYPSQAQFYNAMLRKNHNPREEDMKTIVPIHNAVNERAWRGVLDWERGRGSNICGGPRLISFIGTPGKISPKVLGNRLLGYAPPFDTHRWKVDRCGTEITYIIDFYSGQGGGPSFYLDVRPALTNWESIKMRLEGILPSGSASPPAPLTSTPPTPK